MQEIITYTELKSDIYSQKVDTYQKIYEAFIKNDYFPWVLMILLYNYKNWKRPVIFILIVHWFLRSIGDLLNNMLPNMPWAPNTYWPYTNKAWLICCAYANVFWLFGEIVGDWYPYLRTKAVTNNNRKVKIVLITCIIYNIVKVVNMYCYFADYPIDFRLKDDNGNLVKDIAKFKIKWWSVEIILQLASCIYDLSVIYALKACLFNRLKQYKDYSENTFLNKFKQISEYRIIISMINSLIFLPFVIVFVIYLVGKYKDKSTVSYIPSDETVDYLRRAVLNFNYTLMYIDQILLKSYANQNISQKQIDSYSTGPSFNTSNNNNSKMNYSQNGFSYDNNNPVSSKIANNLNNNYLDNDTYNIYSMYEPNEINDNKKSSMFDKNRYNKNNNLFNQKNSNSYRKLDIYGNDNDLTFINYDKNNNIFNDDAEESTDSFSYLNYYQYETGLEEIKSPGSLLSPMSAADTLYNESFTSSNIKKNSLLFRDYPYEIKNSPESVHVKVSNKKIKFENIPMNKDNKMKIQRRITGY